MNTIITLNQSMVHDITNGSDNYSCEFVLYDKVHYGHFTDDDSGRDSSFSLDIFG